MPSVLPGSHLGPYEILGLIGAGGMGQVWKARDTRLNRVVAIKVAQERFSERFEREARTVAALNNPHICSLFDVGPDYLVMEYIEGRPLEGPLPIDQVVTYAAQICDALDAAHKKQIVHRDLKPGNILVTRSGVKLLDFGLAKHAPADAGEDGPTGVVTQDGVVMGTLQYMSPEQLEGRTVDARSDIYSLGLVLYEMVTGKRAFPPTDRAPLEPPALERVVKTCLARDPDARWQTAREVRLGLEWSTESGGVLQPAGTSLRRLRRERTAWILAAACLGFAMLFAGLYWTAPFRAQVPGAVVRLSLNPPEKTVFAVSVNATIPVAQFALSPDGRTIAFVAGAAGSRPILWVRPLHDVAARPLAGTEDAQNPFWSPDSLWVGFFAEGKLKKVPALGGAVQEIASNVADSRGGSWASDDTLLFADGNSPINRVSSRGGSVTPVTHLDAALQEGTHRFPYVLPDGQHFLYTVRSTLAEQGGVYVGSLDGSIKKRLLRFDSSAIYVPPGYLLYLDGDTLLGQRFDAGRLELTGQPVTVAGQVGRSTTGQIPVSASSEGTMAYASTHLQSGRLMWFNRDDGSRLDMALAEDDYTDFRLSPDEKRLAWTRVNRRTGQPEIWLTDIERGSSSPFAVGPQLNSAPVWSPDGTRLFFRTNRSGLVEIYQKSAAGGGNEEVVMSTEVLRRAGWISTTHYPSDWSANGNLLFSIGRTASGYDLALLPMASDPRPVLLIESPADQMHGNFSPDGKLVAYSSNEAGRFEVYVETVPRSDFKRAISTNGGSEPRWRGDGREIYYLAEDRTLMAVPVEAGLTFGRPRQLVKTDVPPGVSPYRTSYVPTGDGRRFLIKTRGVDPAPMSITIVLNWTARLSE
ncbi:MAG TPA: protein kinase [Vicinamibacterales bacterium]|nr:protein kinase [Vicinamibacterales bacterium]